MDDGIGLAEALLGLDGFRVLEVAEGPAELVITIESVPQVVGCGRCGVRAEAQDRMPIDIRDLTLSLYGRLRGLGPRVHPQGGPSRDLQRVPCPDHEGESHDGP